MSAKPRALEVAERLWPPPDPLNFAKREAVAEARHAELAVRRAEDLRAEASTILFEDLARLWLHETRAEILLALERETLLDAALHLGNAIDYIKSARFENWNQHADEVLRDRQERRNA